MLDGQPLTSHDSLRFVPEEVEKVWRDDAFGQLFDERDRIAQIANYDRFRELVGDIHRAGVPILAGTDGALVGEAPWLVPGFSLHVELTLLVSAGLSPMDAIVAATSAPARVFGREDTGTIEAGKSADLVLLRADPTIDIRNTASIEAVISAGRLFRRDELDSMLDRVESALQGTSMVRFDE
jgi:imidazolonepropionase-like amidohydrolase